MDNFPQIIEHKGQNVVNARELHEFLDSKQEFSNWMKNRINKFGFTENQDYTSFDKIIKRENGATTRTEYAITLDMAKELSMVENNDRGREARRYFIECEKQLRDPSRMSRLEIAKMLVEAEEEKIRYQRQAELQSVELKKAAPKVEYFEQVLQSEEGIPVSKIAKEFGMGAPSLNRMLHQRGIQYQQNGTWLLYHKYQNRGYTKTKTHSFVDEYGKMRTTMHTYWTEKGRLFIHEIMKDRPRNTKRE